MSEGGGVRGIVLAHGLLAKGLVDAVRKISGADEGLIIPVSNEGKSPQTLQEELGKLLEGGPVIVFTDLPSGSCALVARTCCRGDAGQVVVSGVNLPILLDFVFNHHLPLRELVPRLLSKGMGSVRSAPEFPDHAHRPVSD